MSETSNQKDRLFRLIALLRLIPREPKRISVSELRDKLRVQGFEITTRSLQRDLSGKLSTEFPLLSLEVGKTNYWSFREDAPQWDLPNLDPSAALAFLLAESHLEKLLPYGILELLKPYFEHARAQLEKDKQRRPARWAERVRSLPNGKTLLPAQVNSEIWSTVSNALMEEQCLHITYLSRSKQVPAEFVVHPAGLVARHSQSYLLARVDGFDDVRQFALHRIQSATRHDTQTAVPDDFNIDHYMHGNFNNPTSTEPVELVADISPQIAWILNETSLSNEQTLTPLPDSDWMRLHARVPDDKETLWWVFGLGENVRVYEPQSWAQVIRSKIARLGVLYAQESSL